MQCLDSRGNKQTNNNNKQKERNRKKEESKTMGNWDRR